MNMTLRVILRVLVINSLQTLTEFVKLNTKYDEADVTNALNVYMYGT